jgi:two-component system alkaline phosphatase synthesis response regulator PhoP
MFTILILEDELDLGLTLAENLSTSDQTCSLFQNLKDAITALSKKSFDVYVLDVNLQDGNGLDFAQKILDQNPTAPIIFVSATSDPELRLRGLELGAFDFINKPFTLKELQIKIDRIKKELKLLKSHSQILQFGPLIVDFAKFEITDANGHVTTLTHKECAILKLFLDNLNRVVSRDEILDYAWGKDSYPNLRTIDNYIVNLRKWCESTPTEVLTIQSIRGVGYKMISKGNI